jgi:hypothetical protein
MPVIYTIDAREKVIRTQCVGNVTPEEVIDHFRSVERDPDSADHLDVLLDLSDLTSLPESKQFPAVVAEINRIRKRIRFDVCAIVATTDVVFGMLRIFEVMAEEYFRAIRVFRVASDAEAWLMSERVKSQKLPAE